MTTSFNKTFEVPCDLQTLLSLMKDKKSLGRLMEASYAQNPNFSVTSSADGSTAIHLYREFEGEWPSWAEAVVGKTLAISEERIWQEPVGNICNGTTEITALRDKARINATLRILENAGNCTVSIAGHIKVNVSLFLDKLGEELIKNEMLEAIDVEHQHYLDELKKLHL